MNKFVPEDNPMHQHTIGIWKKKRTNEWIGL